MEEKERYEVIYNEDELGYCIIDTEEELSDDIHSFNIIADLLNQQDKRIKELKEENQQFKQKAIVPLETKLYMIPTEFNGLKTIKDYTLLSISLSSIGVRYEMSINKKERGIEPFYCASEDMFGESIFVTREEAEQKLAKTGGTLWKI
mgnify:FL=1